MQNAGSMCVYPLPDLRLVSKGQQVDIRLQGTGLNHSLVSGEKTHNITHKDH